jgi:hypothetical protein
MNTKKKGAGSSPTRRASKPSHMTEREAAFRIYRDMGVGRTYEKLRVAFAKGHVAVTTRTLANWAKAHDWRKRVDDHDIAIVEMPSTALKTDPGFDQVDTLLRTAHLALQRVLASAPIVMRASDAKALTDAALGALKVVELIKTREAEKAPPGKGRAEMFLVLGMIEARVRAADEEVARVTAIAKAAGVGIPKADEEVVVSLSDDRPEKGANGHSSNDL